MEAYRLILEERARCAKAIARRRPTTENITAYGRAIMNRWDAKLLQPAGAIKPLLRAVPV
jgi:hypothetical protein